VKNRFVFRACEPFLILTVVLGLTGCSKGLSRDQAADVIQKSPGFEQTFDAKVALGKCWYKWRDMQSFSGDLAVYKALQDNGVLTVKESSNIYAVQWKEYVVELTPKGQEAALTSWVKTPEKVDSSSAGRPSPDSTIYVVHLARKRWVGVTGIAMDSGGKKAIVGFDWEWAPTDQAALFSANAPGPDVHHGKASLELFDDDWKIDQISIEGDNLPLSPGVVPSPV
jgi:hypothetical protein